MDAPGALDSFLGRLTTVLVNEAQLLGRVRSDVEFIKDEMESMNGLILHLTEAQHRDHQVRAWMKQVVGLTRDCEGNVELYIHYVGSRPGGGSLLGHLRRVVRFLRTIPVRHRIATRIRELKVRAQDVGDRRHRYGVSVPALATTNIDVFDIEPAAKEEYIERRSILLYAAEYLDSVEVVRRGIDTLMKWLSAEPATTEDGVPQSQVKVFCVLGRKLAVEVADEVYKRHSSVATIFNCRASSHWSGPGVGTLTNILKQVRDVQKEPGQEEDELTNHAAGTTVEDKEKRLVSKSQEHLKGKCFLIVLHLYCDFNSERKWILDALLQAECLPGSAIIMSRMDYEEVLLSSPNKIINAQEPEYEKFFRRNLGNLGADLDKKSYFDFYELCQSDTFVMKTFRHLLYVNPNRKEDELQKYINDISECIRLKRSISKQVLLWCYNELPSKYRSCLLYLSVFPEGHVIRTTSLARRWVAEGLITATSTSTPTDDEIQSSSTDEAEHCLDVLFTRGFVSPVEIYAADNIKSYIVHRQVREFIARVARDVNFVDSSLPPHLARHLSIHNRIGLQKSLSDGDSKDIATYLPSLCKSPQWQLLKVLDLDGCHGLEKQHLKSICKILLLKYLSLRNTDVAELPKQIKELQCLETLDVRETKVQVLAKKATVLPLLKHFLAGHKVSAANDSTTSEDPFSAVQMPLCIGKMNNMEILSHVRVSNSKQLAGIVELLKLRKLGIALHGKQTKLSDLFCQIEKLHTCLRSLSIRIDPQSAGEIEDMKMPSFIERLNISGITGGLRHLIQEHHKLTKITLCGTHLKEDDIAILGKLGALQCLRLQHNSYTTECEIVFKEEEFQSLDYLLVQGKDIANIISFASGAAPRLERIVWCFARMYAVSGLNHLTNLKKLELNGDCDLDPIEQELLRHPNIPALKHKPQQQHQEARSAASTSS